MADTSYLQVNNRRSAIKYQSPGQDNVKKATWIWRFVKKGIKSLGNYTKDGFEHSPTRCFALKAHYSWTAFANFMFFFYASSTWFGEEPIKCYEHYDLKRAEPEVEDICIQFPYTTYKNHTVYLDHERQYNTQYLWIHWAFAVIGILYYSVAIVSKVLEKSHLRDFINRLEETLDYDERYKMTCEYLQYHFGGHGGLITSVIYALFYSIFINVTSFLVLNAFFLNKYWSLPYLFTTQRDPSHFDDPISVLFPPFALCDISPSLHIQVGRTNIYGCQLPLNDIYFKFFMAFWLWQAFLLVMSIYSLFMYANTFLNQKSHHILSDGYIDRYPAYKKSAKRLSKDDAMALLLIRGYLFNPHFRMIVECLATWRPENCDFKVDKVVQDLYLPNILQQKAEFDLKTGAAGDTIIEFLDGFDDDDVSTIVVKPEDDDKTDKDDEDKKKDDSKKKDEDNKKKDDDRKKDDEKSIRGSRTNLVSKNSIRHSTQLRNIKENDTSPKGKGNKNDDKKDNKNDKDTKDKKSGSNKDKKNENVSDDEEEGSELLADKPRRLPNGWFAPMKMYAMTIPSLKKVAKPKETFRMKPPKKEYKEESKDCANEEEADPEPSAPVEESDNEKKSPFDKKDDAKEKDKDLDLGFTSKKSKKNRRK